jgi:cytochrome P450
MNSIGFKHWYRKQSESKKGKHMHNTRTVEWQSGITDAPLPPLVDPRALGETSRVFVECYRQLGPIFRLPRPAKPLTVLAGPEANTFLARYEDEFFTTREFWQDFDTSMGIGGTGGMSQARDGAANRQRRARSSRSYSRARVLDQLPRMIEITHEYTRTWQPGQSITVLPAMQRVVAEQLGQLLVRYSPGDYLPDFITYLNTNITTSLPGMDTQARAALSSPEYLRAKERVYELGRMILEAHLAAPAPNGKPDLVDDVLADVAKHPERYPKASLSHAGLGPLLAGLDTVANSCSFMIYALLKYPEAQKRVVTEVDNVFAQGLLTWETLKTMQALHGAAMETLRLYPVAGGHTTRVAKPLTFAGYRLEPGEDVFVAMTVPHFLAEFFPEPEQFDIDRFSDPRNEHRKPGAYAPFGLGEHTCLGVGIAEIQLMVIIATLLHTYQLELDPPDYELTIEHDPTPTPGKHFRVKIVAERQPEQRK